MVNKLLANTMDLRDPATVKSLSTRIMRPSVSRPVEKLSKGEPMALGITQILVGILEIAFGLVRVLAEYEKQFYNHSHHVTTPYWMGILYVISGSLSVAVAKNPKIPLVKGMLGMNVVSTVAAGIGIFLLLFSVTDSGYYNECDPLSDRIMSKICHETITIPETVVIFQNTTQEAPPAVLTPAKEDETP